MRCVYYDIDGLLCKQLLDRDGLVWLIDRTGKHAPFAIEKALLKDAMPVIECAADEAVQRSEKCQATFHKRLSVIEPMLKDELCILDSEHRNSIAQQCAQANGYSVRTVKELYNRVLALGKDALYTSDREPTATPFEKDIRWGINKFYFSSKRMSLRRAYVLLLLERFTDSKDGLLPHPTYNQFYYYYRKHMQSSTKKIISREGITKYRQNYRPLYGSASQGIDFIGVYQMDATDADIRNIETCP